MYVVQGGGAAGEGFTTFCGQGELLVHIPPPLAAEVLVG